MRIRADEHVSPVIVRVVCDTALSKDWELTSVITEGDRSKTDVHWITQFGRSGGHAILTADGDFINRPHQVMAVHELGLKIIHLPHKWQNARRDLQAAHILLWWKRIEATISSMKQCECYRPPWNTIETGELTKIKVDYEAARKKLEKAARREETAA